MTLFCMTHNPHGLKQPFSIKYVILIILKTLCMKSDVFTLAASIENEEQPSEERVCTTQECMKAAEQIAWNMDTTVEPCDNFYRFACGGFVRKTEIPPGQIGTNLLLKSKLELDETLKVSIEQKVNSDDHRTLNLLQSHYNTCLNSSITRKTDRQLVLDIINELGGWPVLLGKSWDRSNFDWKKLIYKARRKGLIKAMNSIINFKIETYGTDEIKNIAFLDDAIIGTKKELLMGGFNGVHEYFKQMMYLAKLLGADEKEAVDELLKSLKFEIKLAMITNDSIEPYHLTIQKLESKYPGFPWNEYFNEFLEPHTHTHPDSEVFVNLVYVKKLLNLILKTDERVIANYVIWRVVQELAEFINFERNDTADEILNWQQCIKYVASKMPLATEALYVRKEFNQTLKTDAQKLVDNLRKSFKRFISEAQWMSATTRSAAEKKLDFMHVNVAIPDEFLNDKILDDYYQDLDVYSESFLKSKLALQLFNFGKEVERFSKPINRSDWTIHGLSAAVTAQYYTEDNSIDIPAGALQKGLFASDRPNYLNYGITGFIVGHEFTHGFDSVSRRYNEQGVGVDWWDPETNNEYEKRVQCIVDQCNNYTISGRHINGTLTEDENIADVGGIKWAYYAYDELTREIGEEPRLPQLDYSPRQLFWISAANLWCNKFIPQIDLLSNQLYSPGEFRVVGPFCNMPEFSRDFDCSLESPMNPSKKCSIW